MCDEKCSMILILWSTAIGDGDDIFCYCCTLTRLLLICRACVDCIHWLFSQLHYWCVLHYRWCLEVRCKFCCYLADDIRIDDCRYDDCVLMIVITHDHDNCRWWLMWPLLTCLHYVTMWWYILIVMKCRADLMMIEHILLALLPVMIDLFCALWYYWKLCWFDCLDGVLWKYDAIMVLFYYVLLFWPLMLMMEMMIFLPVIDDDTIVMMIWWCFICCNCHSVLRGWVGILYSITGVWWCYDIHSVEGRGRHCVMPLREVMEAGGPGWWLC